MKYKWAWFVILGAAALFMYFSIMVKVGGS